MATEPNAKRARPSTPDSDLGPESVDEGDAAFKAQSLFIQNTNVLYMNPVSLAPFGPWDKRLGCGHVVPATHADITCPTCRQIHVGRPFEARPALPGNVVDPVFYGTVKSWIELHEYTLYSSCIPAYMDMHRESAEELNELRSTVNAALNDGPDEDRCKAFKELCTTHLVNCAYAEPDWVKPSDIISSGKVCLNFFFTSWLYGAGLAKNAFWERPDFAGIVTAAIMECPITEMDNIELFVIGFGYMVKASTPDPSTPNYTWEQASALVPIPLAQSLLLPVFQELLRRFAFYAKPPEGCGNSPRWLCKKCKAWRRSLQPHEWFCGCTTEQDGVALIPELKVNNLRNQVSKDVCDRLALFTQATIVKGASVLDYPKWAKAVKPVNTNFGNPN